MLDWIKRAAARLWLRVTAWWGGLPPAAQWGIIAGAAVILWLLC
jgi:hypothetical protein